MVVYDEEGNLELKVEHDENDFEFDEIGSVLKIKELQNTKRELFESLELYYKVKYLGENDPLGLLHGKVYDVVSVERGMYRIVDETKEDYLYFPELFEIVQE